MSSQAFRPFRPQDRKGLLHFPCQKKNQNLRSRWSFLRCSFSDPGFVPQWYGDPTNDLLMLCQMCRSVCCMDLGLVDLRPFFDPFGENTKRVELDFFHPFKN